MCKAKLLELHEEIDKHIIIVGDFNTSLFSSWEIKQAKYQYE